MGRKTIEQYEREIDELNCRIEEQEAALKALRLYKSTREEADTVPDDVYINARHTLDALDRLIRNYSGEMTSTSLYITSKVKEMVLLEVRQLKEIQK